MTLRRKLGWVAVLYFAEGLPFGVVKEMMPVYLRSSGVDLTAIGLYSLIGLPWTLKVAVVAADRPLRRPAHVDRGVPRRARRRHGARCGSIAPTAALLVGVVMLLIAFASATQDIAIDAYTIGLVEPGEEGDTNGVRVTAARIALIASGGGLVLLSTWLGWPAVFAVAAALPSAVLAVLVPWAPRVAVSAESRRLWLEPLRDWVARPGAAAVFAFVLLYKLGDAAMGPMIKPFWLDSRPERRRGGHRVQHRRHARDHRRRDRRRPVHRPLRHLARAARARPGAGAVQPRLRDRRLAQPAARRPPSVQRSPTRSPRSASRRGR